MDTELIIFNEYCQKSHTDPTFIISLDIEGIDAIHHMLERMERLQQEVSFLRRQLRRFQTKDDFFQEEY